nr:transposase [Paenibacillus hamazuiensis]
MGEQRQRYNEEFKKQTVKYVQEQTKTVPEIAAELNIPAGTIHNWLAQYRSFENEPLATPEKLRQMKEELEAKDRANKQKDREIADLQEELAILKKALHIFSKEKN